MSNADSRKKYDNRYTLGDIVKEIFQVYQLNHTQISAPVLEKELKKICKETIFYEDSRKINLWEKNCEPRGKEKTIHFFDEHEKKYLMCCKKLLDYIYERSPDTAFEKYYGAYKEAEKANQEYDEWRANLTQEDYDQMRADEEADARHSCSWQEVHQKKIELMIEALYLELFEEIDELELKKDMDMSAAGGGNDNTAESVMAYEHLAEGIKYYCKKKKEEKEAEKEEKATQKPGQK